MKRCISCDCRFGGPEWTCPCCGFAPEMSGTIVRFATPIGKDGFDPQAFDYLAELEHDSFWFRSRNRLIDWAVARYFPNAGSLLEIGCGTGFVLEGLLATHPQLRLLGADLHLGGLAHAAQRTPELSLLQLDARQIPFDAEFDVIGAFDVLEHIEDDRRVLAEMRTAVKPGGGIVLTVPQHPVLWSASDDYAQHKRRYRRSELVTNVLAAGFAIRRVTSFVTLLLPAMAGMRLGHRLSRRPLDPNHEHLLAQRITRPLEGALELERRLIARGTDLPIGGSLLLVAERIA